MLPLIDYAAVRKQPKIYVSYSDGTSILNSIYNKTGLMTYYGQTPGLLKDLRHYDYMQFAAHFLDGNVTSFSDMQQQVAYIKSGRLQRKGL